MRTSRWWLAILLVVWVGACTWPGHSGWNCDSNKDCSSGLTCRSVHNDREGYSTVCLGPDESITVGGNGDWLHFLMWPFMGVCVAGGAIIRSLARRADRRRLEARKTRFRRS